jgi:ferritin-like metal-binding protein YciE
MANNQMMEPSMAQTAREIFIVGLRNAHAMETQARELMERQSDGLTNIRRSRRIDRPSPGEQMSS